MDELTIGYELSLFVGENQGYGGISWKLFSRPGVFLVQTALQKNFKGALSGLKQFLAVESPLQMMNKALYFMFKALFVLWMFKFLIFDQKDKVNFKICEVTLWETNNCNTHIV